MSKVRVLGLAAGALLLFGVQQIAGAATAAAQDNPAEMSAPTGAVDKAAYSERRGQGRGNIYGSQGVIGHSGAVRRGYYGASGHRTHSYAHRYYRPRYGAATGYYGAAGYNSRYYAHRYYPARAAVADSYFGSTGYYPQYYSHRYYPTRPAAPTHISARQATTRNTIHVAIIRLALLLPTPITARQATIRPNPSEQRSPPPIFLHQPIGEPAVLTAWSAPAATLIVAASRFAAAGLPAITRRKSRGSRLMVAAALFLPLKSRQPIVCTKAAPFWG